MKRNLIFKLIVLGLFVVQIAPAAGPDQADSLKRNRFTLGFDAGFNVRAEFVNLAPNVAPPPATGSGLTGDPVDREYEDGYSRVDFFDNGGGLTWNWGYENDSQYDGTATTVDMHTTSRSGYGTSTTATDDPQLGFELRYARVMGTIGENKTWGFEGAFGYMNMSIKQEGSLSSVQRITDTYDLSQPLLPEYQPYQGTFNGPGPLIGDLPDRAVENASSSGWNELSGNLFALRLGPFLELPLSVGVVTDGWTTSRAPSKFFTKLGAGLSLIYADTDFSYNETATFTDGSSISASGAGSTSEVLFGGYLQGELGYWMNDSWSLFGGLRLETATGLTATAGNREADLKLGGTFHAVFGVGYTF